MLKKNKKTKKDHYNINELQMICTGVEDPIRTARRGSLRILVSQYMSAYELHKSETFFIFARHFIL